MMMRWLLVISVLGLSLVNPGSGRAAGGDELWSYRAATAGKQDIRAAVVDAAGNTIVVGVDGEGSSSNYLIGKVLADGSGLAWPAVVADISGWIDVAVAVAVDHNDDILVTGYSHNGSNFDIHTRKYAGSDGSLLWQHSFAGVAGGDDFATAIGVDGSDNVYVGGYLQGSGGQDDMVVIKYLPTGPNVDDTPTWATVIDGAAGGNDRLMALAVGSDGVAVTGESESSTPGDFDCLTHKLGLDGSFLWSTPRVYADSGNGKGLSVGIDSGGNVVMSGYVDNGSRQPYAAKYPGTDDPAIWVKLEPAGTVEGGHALLIDEDDDVYVTGTSWTVSEAYDLFTVKYQGDNPVGGVPVTLWQDSYNSSNGNNDIGLYLALAPGGGDLFVTGFSNDAVGGYDDIVTLKYGRDSGARLWPLTVYDAAGLHDRPAGIGIALDGSVRVGGWSDTAATSYDLVAVSYDPGVVDPPTGLTATVINNTEIRLDWTNHATGATAIVLERSAATPDDWTVVRDDLAPTTISYNDTGLTADTRYYYRVKAEQSGVGSSAYSGIVHARTTVISYDSPAWLAVYAGGDAGDDDPAGIACGPDGDPVVTGSSFSFEGGYDYYTLKFDRSDPLVVRWGDRYNDGDNEGDTATSVAVDSQDRPVVTGYASLFAAGGSGNTNDIYTIGYAATGQPERWSDQYNGPAGDDDKSQAVAVTTNGNDLSAVIGYGKNDKPTPDNDLYVLLFDGDGRLWAATPYDGGGDDFPVAVAFDGSDNVLVAGQSHNGSDFDWFVAKYDRITGSRNWLALPHAYAGNGDDYAEDVAVDAAGDVYVTGYATNASAGLDIYTVKYRGSDGAILWQQGYDGGGYDHGKGIGIDPANGEVLVGGTSYVGVGNKDLRLIRYLAAGDGGGAGQEVWNKRLDLPGTDDELVAMALDRTGVAVLTGSSDDDILAVKYDHTGTIVGATSFDGAAAGLDYPASVTVNRWGEAFIAGSSLNADSVPNTDYVVFKVAGEVMQAPTPLSATQLYSEVALFWVDNALDETGYQLQRALGSCATVTDGDFGTLGNFSPAVLSHIDSPVNANTTYCYRLRAESATDVSRWLMLEVTTADPAPPEGLSATLVNDTDIELTWTDTTTAASGYEFEIQRCSGAGCDFALHDTFTVSASVATDPQAGLARYVDGTGCSGLAYRYRVLAHKPGLWNSGFSNETGFGGVAPLTPAIPSNLVLDRASETLVDLSWDDNGDGETEFLVERCDDTAANCGSGPFATVGTLASISGNLLSLRMDEASWDGTPSQVIDRSGWGNHGTASGATTTSYGRYGRAGRFNASYDSVATGLLLDQSATSGGATFALWAKPTDAGTGATRYLVGTDNGGNDWSLLQADGTWWLATGEDAALRDTAVAVTVGSWQHLAVTFDPATGVKLYKNGSQLYSNPGIDTDASSAAVLLGMTSNGNGNTAFAGDLDEVSVFDRPLSVTEINTLYQHGIARFRDSSIAVNGTYTYRVRADKPGSCGSDWPSAPTALLEVSTAPPGPDLSAAVANTGVVRLSWVPNTTTQTGFRVERCEVGVDCPSYTVLASSLAAATTTYSDTTTCTGPTYRYRVLATQSAGWGDSTPSNSADAAIPALTAPVSISTGDISEGHLTVTWPYPSPAPTGYRIGQCDATATTCSQDSDFLPTIETPGLGPDNLLLLHMDEVGWTNGVADVADSSGLGNTGTSYNGAAIVTDGKYGSAGLFEGTNDYIATAVMTDQSATGPGLTLEAWAYPTANDANYRFVISTENSGLDWGIYQRYTNWYVTNGASYISVGAVADLDQWQHLVAVFEPGVGVRFYKNGVQTYSNAAIDYDSSTTTVTIGRRGTSTSASYHFSGRIDEVAVYDRALTATEAQNRYNRIHTWRSEVLSPNNDYRYRAWAYRNDPCNSEGPYVQTAAVATTATVPVPSGLTASDVGTTTVDLSWSVPTTSETLVRLERCAGSGTACDEDAEFGDFGAAVVLPADTQSYVDTTICAESEYTYRVRLERDVAPLWQSGWATAVRPAQSLPVLSGLSAVGISESEIRIGWDDLAADQDGYLLERCQDSDFSCGTPTLVKTELASRLIYHLDEATWVNNTADVADSSHHAGHATSYSGAATTATAWRGRAGDLTGSSDYILTPVAIDQSATGPGATFAAWVYPTAQSGSYHFHVISTENGGYDWSIVHYNGLWYLYNGSTVISTGRPVDLNQWQHVAATFDPAGGVTFYKNGGTDPADIFSNATISFDTSTANVTFGRYASSTSTSYNYIGLIDEVVITPGVVSAAEVLANYQQSALEMIDAGLAPGTTYSYRLTADKTVAGGCSWSRTATTTAVTQSPPAPGNFQVASKNTTELHLVWEDLSGSETEYQLQRCDQTAAVCGVLDANFTVLDMTLGEGAQSYDDLTVCPGATYTYRVRARKTSGSPQWDTTWVYREASADVVASLANLGLTRVSEVRIDLSWDDANGDEDGFIIERCQGSGCSGYVPIDSISSAAATVAYQDDELEPGMTYRYRVKATKSAICGGGWETAYLGPQEETVSVELPNLLSATPITTTRIDLAWSANAPSATGVAVERCNGHPCQDAYVQVATANIGAAGFADDSVCNDSSYSYRVRSVGEGLSLNAGGCWTRLAPVVFTSFAADSRFELPVSYDADMRPDFADLRFFDATAQRELSYWIAAKTDGVAATVYLHTAANDNIFMYYGNPAASDAGRMDDFLVYQDDFPGTAIDTGKYYIVGSYDYIVQNDGLQLIDVVINSGWGGLVSKQTFERSDGLEAVYDISLPADSYEANYFAVGWYKNQTTSNSTTYFAHQLYWYNNTELQTYDNGSAKDPGNFAIANNTDYLVKVTPNATAGARYFVKGGIYPDWTLVTDTVGDASPCSDATLRLAILQQSEEATINSVLVRKVIIPNVASFGVEQDLGGACYGIGYSWQSGYSVEDVWAATGTPQAPVLASATVVSDTGVNLLWSNPGDADAGFAVERCCDGGCPGYAEIGTAPAGATGFSDAAAPPSGDCSYRVRAQKSTPSCSWQSGPSNIETVQLDPATAGAVSAIAENSRMIRVDWSDLAIDEDGYEIEVQRGTGYFVHTANVFADTELYYDNRNIEPQTTYRYRVRSFREVTPGVFVYSPYSYSNAETTPAWSGTDGTCLP